MSEIFAGAVYDPAEDDARLSGQILRVYDLMRDGQWRTLGEIEAVTGDPQGSISAQLRHLRKERFGSYNVEKRPRGVRSDGLFEYRVGDPLPKTEPSPAAVKRKPFLAGMMYASKFAMTAADLPTLKSTLKHELLKAAERTT